MTTDQRQLPDQLPNQLPNSIETPFPSPGKPRVVMTASSARYDETLSAEAATKDSGTETKADIKNLSFFYGATRALAGVNLSLANNAATALIGPSGCGKTTLLRCFNRMHDLYPGNRYEGEILLRPEGVNIIDRRIDPMEMRLRVGMVFQKPNPFPKSIFENVAFGLRLKGIRQRDLLEERVETTLKSVNLWNEVKDRLRRSAYALSGGQQQRLCIARALAPEPEILLFDEPTSALDPASTARIEDLIYELKDRLTIIIVTHNMQQAARVSDNTVFLYHGEVIEAGATPRIFGNPAKKLTAEYITGRFG
jgi:phosphate transport system ATP-binding protein